MQNALFAVLGLIAPLCLAATVAIAAPPAKTAEDHASHIFQFSRLSFTHA